MYCIDAAFNQSLSLIPGNSSHQRQVIIGAPAIVTNGEPAADSAMVDWLWISLRSYFISCCKFTSDLSEICKIAVNRKFLGMRSTSENDMHVVRHHTLNR